ncbi:VanZ family protein [Agromyces sp. NPDC056379]|uniref:VanZ family protein n=1 Tax=unclassified Agromyces TaxID=2639701 RepID=UPI0035E02D44
MDSHADASSRLDSAGATRHRVASLIARWLLPPYLVLVGLVVFLPAPAAGRITGVVGWAADVLADLGAPREASAIVLEFLANIALFVPFGVLVALAFPTVRWWKVVLAGALTSIGIEVVQVALPTRFPSVSDVVANTIGTAVGLGLILWWSRARRPLDSDRSPT